LGLGYNDVKPANILRNGDKYALCDLGAVRILGHAADEYTKEYCLESSPISSVTYDLSCLGVSLLRLYVPKAKISTRADIEQVLSEGKTTMMDRFCKSVIKSCFDTKMTALDLAISILSATLPDWAQNQTKNTRTLAFITILLDLTGLIPALCTLISEYFLIDLVFM